MTVPNAVSSFYDALQRLQSKHPNGKAFSFSPSTNPFAIPGMPKNGIYFFFEKGETRKGSSKLRVVRVGTHGLRKNNNRLLKRIGTHYFGNIRRSAFRKLIAEAQKGKLLPKKTIPVLEPQISHHLFCQMNFLLLPVQNALHRQQIEKISIGILSNCLNPVDPPSNSWLGSHHPDPRVSKSGLWNLDHVSLFCKKLSYTKGVVKTSSKGIRLSPTQDYAFLKEFLALFEEYVSRCPKLNDLA
jgi:hypothetical protein